MMGLGDRPVQEHETTRGFSSVRRLGGHRGRNRIRHAPAMTALRGKAPPSPARTGSRRNRARAAERHPLSGHAARNSAPGGGSAHRRPATDRRPVPAIGEAPRTLARSRTGPRAVHHAASVPRSPRGAEILDQPGRRRYRISLFASGDRTVTSSRPVTRVRPGTGVRRIGRLRPGGGAAPPRVRPGTLKSCADAEPPGATRSARRSPAPAARPSQTTPPRGRAGCPP